MALTKRKILDTLEFSDALPSFPEVVLKLQQEMTKEEPSLDNVIAMVQEDPPLTGKFIQLANSAYFARAKPIMSVDQAVFRLGLVESKKLISAASLVTQTQALGKMNKKQYWSHCLAVALTCEIIANSHSTNQELAESAFAAGLLHDIGVLAIFGMFAKQYKALIDGAAKKGVSIYSEELDRWKTSHTAAGAITARRWGLPDPISYSIEYHHNPSAAKHQIEMASLVNVADMMCNSQGFGRLPKDDQPEVTFDQADEASWELFSLTWDDVSPIMDKVREESEHFNIFIDI